MNEQHSAQLNYVEWFRKTTPYINAHRNRRFVIHIDGETVDTPDFYPICQDISLLSSLGIHLVVVFGLRSQIDKELARHGIESTFIEQIRVTPAESMYHIEAVAGRVRSQIEATLSMGLPNTPMEGSKLQVVSGNLITARPIGVHRGEDYFYTGAVRRVQSETIRTLLDQRAVVLISPIGVSSTGESFNLSSTEASLAVATAIHAEKLIFISRHLSATQSATQPATQPATQVESALPREITSAQARHLISEGAFNPNLLSLLEHGVQACDGVVNRVHLLDSTRNGVLLEELFTPDGVGTLLTQDSYETLRTATVADIPGMLDIISPLEAKEILVPRGQETLELDIDNYIILERDNFVIACAGLYPYPEESSAEVGCFAIGSHYQNQGRGKVILRQIEKIAQARGIKELFVVTTQATHWFIEQGFSPAEFSALPQKKQERYNLSRNPKVLIKSLVGKKSS